MRCESRNTANWRIRRAKCTQRMCRLAVCLVFGAVFQLICLAIDTDVSGTWDMAVESQQGTAHPTIVLKQSGEKITGTYRGRMGETSLEGTIRGDRIRFSVTLKFQDQPITITYSGTVQNDTMRGTAQFGDSGSGSWSASRKTT